MPTQFDALVSKKSEEELLEIAGHEHKYQPDMVAAATSELMTRGVDISQIAVEKTAVYDENEAALAAGKEGNGLYLIICLIAAFLGGLIGIIGGYIYAFSKTTSLRGTRYYVYNKSTRQWGIAIFIIGITCFFLALFLRMSSSYGL